MRNWIAEAGDNGALEFFCDAVVPSQPEESMAVTRTPPRFDKEEEDRRGDQPESGNALNLETPARSAEDRLSVKRNNCGILCQEAPAAARGAHRRREAPMAGARAPTRLFVPESKIAVYSGRLSRENVFSGHFSRRARCSVSGSFPRDLELRRMA